MLLAPPDIPAPNTLFPLIANRTCVSLQTASMAVLQISNGPFLELFDPTTI